MQVFVEIILAQHEINIPMFQSTKLDDNQIGSAGVTHIMKAHWRNIEKISMGYFVMIKGETHWMLIYLGNSQEIQ